MEQRQAYKSFCYKAKTTWSNARRGLLAAEARPDIVVGSPPEFKGEPGNWAPEELLVGALNTCTMLTFLALAEGRGLRPIGCESEAEGQLENVEGNYQITKIVVRPRVTISNGAQRRSKVLHRKFHQGRRDACPGVRPRLHDRLSPHTALAPSCWKPR